jgi:cytochrome c
MDDRFNTTAGWALFAGIIALGGSIVAGELFAADRPEKMGYPIEGVELEGEGGAAADKPIACYLANANAAQGEQVFKKCAACHNADPGGANALGPALYGVMGNPVAAHPGYAFSDALKGKGGQWDWETMSAWLASPRTFAPGTKMTFAGLSNPEERAHILAFLNSRDTAPLPLPAATPEQCADGAAGGAAGGEGNAAAPANGNAAAPAEGTGSSNAPGTELSPPKNVEPEQTGTAQQPQGNAQ